MLLLLAGWQFGYWGATANQQVQADWLTVATWCFSWYDWWWWHNATSSGRGWTDQRQRHDSSSLGWSTVRLVTCDGRSACAGRLINGGDTMLFLGMINGGNTTLLLVGAGGLIDSRDTTLFLLAGQRFGYLRATANQRARADWSTVVTWCFFLVWSMVATQRYFPWLVDGGREHWPFAWCDRQNSDAHRYKTLYKGRNIKWICVGKYSDWKY